MKRIKKYQNTPGPLTPMKSIREKVGEYLLQNGTISDGTYTYKPYASVYPDVYKGYENDINNPENPLLTDEYYEGEDGELHVRKKAIPYAALNKVYVRNDGQIVTADDLDQYTYNFNDSDRLLQSPKYHSDVVRMPYHDQFRDYRMMTDEYGNLIKKPELIGPDTWHDPSENVLNDLLLTGIGTGRLAASGVGKVAEKVLTPTTDELQAAAMNRMFNGGATTVGQRVSNALDYLNPSHYLGVGNYSTVLGGVNRSALGATADAALAANMANTAYNELRENPNVGTIANLGLASIPLLPFRGVPQAIKAGKDVLSMGSEAQQLDEIARLYPHLTPQEVSKTLDLLKRYQSDPNSLGSMIGLHPLLIDEAIVKTKKLNPKPFDPITFGFPDTPKIEISGDVTHTLEPDFGTYRSWYNHPDGSDAGFIINGTEGIISPILRPGNTGIVNKAVQFPMVKEIKGITQNPNFKDYVITTDLMGNPHMYDMFESEIINPDFPRSSLSFDSYQLLHKLIDKDKNLEFISVPSIMEFNNMAFVNKDLSDRFQKFERGLMSDDEIAQFWNDFRAYLEKTKATPAIKGSKTQTIIGSHPMGRIITYKKGSKLIKRKNDKNCHNL